MTRYFNILRIFWSASISAEMEYRVNFLMAALSSVMTLAGTALMLFLFYRSGYQMGGWPWRDALAVVGMFTILEGTQSTFMTPNRTRVTEHVREGTLDFVLLKPIDSQFWLSVRSISLWGVPNIVMGLAIVAYALVTRDTPPLHTPPPPGSVGAVTGISGAGIPGADVLLAGAALLLGVLILYSLGYLLSTLTIWYIKLYNITMAMQALVETGRYPITAYPAAYQVFFTFVLPVAFMTTVPAQFVTGRGGAGWLLGAAVVAGVCLTASIAFWRFALRYYTSASS
jgi:viologen exporter family transport system permease protein